MTLALLLTAGPGDFFGEICPTRQSTAINMLKIQFHPLTKLFQKFKKIIFYNNAALSSLHSRPKFSKGTHVLLATQPTTCSLHVTWV